MSQTTAKPASPAPALGHKVVRGFSWMIAKTLGTKAVNFAGQIILAWLLVPQDFGLIGLAYTVTAFISVLQQAGLQEILIHRQSQFKRWANPVFWLSGCLGVVGMLLTLAAIPLAQRIYHAPELGGILAILSINALIGALSVVPRAKLSNELRFKAIAAIGVSSAAFNIAIACGLAWAGWGAYAIAVGTTAGVIVNTILQWKAAPIRLKRTLQARRWRFIMGDSAAILATSLLMVVPGQGDYIALGIFETAAITGLYFFAFNLSMQTVSLFTLNLTGVLFPALSKLQADTIRQTRAFVRAARMLALVVVPICLLQATIADPVIRLLFPAKWHPAIPVVQILCFGMAWRAVGTPASALMRSQGRFRTLMILSIAYALLYVPLITGGVVWGGMIGLAIAEAVFFMLLGMTHVYVGIRPGQGSITDVTRIYLPAFVGSLLSLMPGLAVAYLIPPIVMRYFIQIGAVLAISVPLYLLIVRQVAGDDWHELSGRIKNVFLRRSMIS